MVTLLDTTPATISTILTAVGDVVEKVIDWTGDFAECIASNNLLLIGCVAVPLCGIGAGMIKRLLRTRV